MSVNTENLYIKCWIGNLGKYNEGELIGEWFTLPVDMEEVAEKIGLNEEYEEWQINDYETNIPGFTIHHYDSIDRLNEFAEQLETLEEDEKLKLMAYCQEYGASQLLREYDSIDFDDCIVYYDVNDMADIAYELVNEYGAFGVIPENILRYFDYEALGRDLDIEGTYVFLDDGVCVEFIR